MSALLTHLDDLSATIQSSLPPQLAPYFTRANLQSILRLVVIISTYILFRPHVDRLIRKAYGTPDPRQDEIDARVEFLKQQQQGMTSVGGKVPIVNKDGKIVKLINPEEAKEASKKQSKKQTPTKTAAGKKAAAKKNGK